MNMLCIVTIGGSTGASGRATQSEVIRVIKNEDTFDSAIADASPARRQLFGSAATGEALGLSDLIHVHQHAGAGVAHAGRGVS